MFFSILYIPYTIRNCPKFSEIMQNSVSRNSSYSAEFRGICDFWCNEIPHNFNFINCTGQASIIGWGRVRWPSLKGHSSKIFWFWFFHQRTSCPIRHKDFKFFQIFFQGGIPNRNRLPVYLPPESHHTPV